MTPASCLHAAATAWLLVAQATPVAATNDSTFFSGPEMGGRLLANVVRIGSLDINEHGFGLVVAAQSRHVFVVTARHVVVPRAQAGAAAPNIDASNRKIEVSFCAGDASGVPGRAAQIVDAFDAGGHDIALLRVPRPAGYEPLLRALALDADVKPGVDSWLLGQEDRCGLAPRSGAVASLRDARDNLRVEFPGARGGESGGPAISGYGVLGLITDAEDLSFTLHSIASLEARLRAQNRDWWQLAAARNIPPTDPLAAQIDLSETLNLYLFAASNLQKLLLRPKVPKQLYFDFANEYNVAVNRFRLARERHDATLKTRWPDGVLEQWQVLRDQLWHAHQTFWKLNDADSQTIFDQQKAPPAVQTSMQALEPELVQLQSSIPAFLQTLTKGVTP